MAAPRSIATATVSFGLVSIPVKLFTSSQTSEGISFRMLHRKCGTPVKQQYLCPLDGEKVDRDEIAKGYEYAKDQYVLFSDEELKALEEEATKTIAIEEFVPLGKVDPIFYDRAYYLGPDRGGERAYRLLAKAMDQLGVGGLARYAARGKQYLVLLRATEGGLVMQQLHYAHEVRPFSEVPIEEKGEIKAAELALAKQLMEQTVTAAFQPEKYEDDVKKRMEEVIQRKVEGQEVSIAPAASPQAQVIDLMEALKASLAGAGAGAAHAAVETGRKPAKSSPRKAAKSAPAVARRAAAGARKKTR
jgi:DNA end-binding protein Ku